MNEIKVNGFLEIHFETKIVREEVRRLGYGNLELLTHVETVKHLELKSYDIFVKTNDGKWHNITHALDGDALYYYQDMVEKRIAEMNMEAAS